REASAPELLLTAGRGRAHPVAGKTRLFGFKSGTLKRSRPCDRLTIYDCTGLTSSRGGGNAERLRRAEASTVAERRRVPPVSDPSSRPRRKDSQSHRSPIFDATRTARRSPIEKSQAPAEGPDGKHPSPSSDGGRLAAGSAPLRRAA